MTTEAYKRYERYLRSGRWRRLRKSKIKASGGFCIRCGDDKLLEVDHIRYKNLIDCTLDDLQVLCHWCHCRKSTKQVWANNLGRRMSQIIKRHPAVLRTLTQETPTQQTPSGGKP